MVEFLENPRRHFRLPTSTRARVAFRAGGFVSARAFDLSPGGCGVELAQRVRAGEKVFVELREPAVFGAQLLSGAIVWASESAPWRCGIAFDRGSACVAGKLVDQLKQAQPPGERPRASYIERVPADAILTRTPVPGQIAVVSHEAEVLSAIGAGVDARTLRERLGERWPPCANALFALLGRGAVQLGRSRG
jgi:hypothetical protein